MSASSDPTRWNDASTRAQAQQDATGRKRRRGTAMIETALVLPVLLLTLLGTLEFGLVLARYQIVLASTREGARVGSLYRENCGAAKVRQEVARAVSRAGSHLGMLLLPSDVQISGACVEGQFVEVEVEYDHYMTFVGGFLEGDLRLPLRARVVMRNETS